MVELLMDLIFFDFLNNGYGYGLVNVFDVVLVVIDGLGKVEG